MRIDNLICFNEINGYQQKGIVNATVANYINKHFGSVVICGWMEEPINSLADEAWHNKKYE